MDPWQCHALKNPSASNNEEKELYFSQLFENEPLPNASFGSFGSSWGSYGSINQFLSPNNHNGPMPRASQNYALTAPEMARLASRRSLENYAISMDSVSPLLDPFKPPLLEPSPLLMPQPGNYTVFPEIDLSGPNTVPRNSYEEDFSPLSAGSTTSTSWNNQRPCSTNVQTHNGNVAYFNSLSQRELNYFFSSDMLVDSLKSISTQTTPDVSPVILPMDGSKSMPIVNIPDIGLADRSMKVSPTGNTGDLGIIQVGMNQATGTMGPQRNVGGTGRRAVGRRGPLDPATRRKAAAMRGKSCSTCRKRKASCDPGIPCRSCVKYFGVRLLQSPCRGKLLDSLADGFLQGPIFPRKRDLQSFLGTAYRYYGTESTIRLKLGFGESVAFPMKIIKPLDARKKLVHKHIVYQWPPRANEATARCSCQHLVFPAVVANTSNLQAVLDRHLGILVDEYFDQFPAYESIFRILRPIQAFYQRLPEGETQQLLRQALKLLTLVHVGGDVQVCDGDATASLLIVKIFGPATGIGTRPYFATCPSNIGALPTPCFIRGQFGEVMPLLAQDLMKDVLVRLELLSLARECNQWANACATFAVFVMAVESIQYHTKKIAFHADGGPAIEEMSRVFGPPAPPELVGQKTQQTQPLSSMEQALQALVGFYKSCFSGCHSRLSDEPGGRQRSSSGGGSALRSGQRDAQESLVTELKKVLAGAQTYLLEKSKASCKTGEDLSCFFDRSLAKLFLLI